MMNTEKMMDMMNPAKAFEAMAQGKVFDAKSQAKWVDTATSQVVGMIDLYQAQTRRAMNMWLDQSEAATKEWKKFVKEWADSVTKVNSDLVSQAESTMKETAKIFELPESEKGAGKKSTKAA